MYILLRDASSLHIPPPIFTRSTPNAHSPLYSHAVIAIKYQECASVLEVVVPALPAVESTPWMTWMSDVVTGTLLPLVIQYSGLEWLYPLTLDGTLGTLSSVCVVRQLPPIWVMYWASARFPTRG